LILSKIVPNPLTYMGTVVQGVRLLEHSLELAVCGAVLPGVTGRPAPALHVQLKTDTA